MRLGRNEPRCNYLHEYRHLHVGESVREWCADENVCDCEGCGDGTSSLSLWESRPFRAGEGNPVYKKSRLSIAILPHPAATQDFAWIDALSESNLCVPLALPVSEQLRTQSTGKASGTH